MKVYDLQTSLSLAKPDEHFYLHVGDGYSATTEFCWLPIAEQWIYHDGERCTTGVANELTFIWSAVDGDESGLNAHARVAACDLSGPKRGLWVMAGAVPAGFKLPDDAEVYIVGDPAAGLQEYEWPVTESAQ